MRNFFKFCFRDMGDEIKSSFSFTSSAKPSIKTDSTHRDFGVWVYVFSQLRHGRRASKQAESLVTPAFTVFEATLTFLGQSKDNRVTGTNSQSVWLTQEIPHLAI